MWTNWSYTLSLTHPPATLSIVPFAPLCSSKSILNYNTKIGRLKFAITYHYFQQSAVVLSVLAKIHIVTANQRELFHCHLYNDGKTHQSFFEYGVSSIHLFLINDLTICELLIINVLTISYVFRSWQLIIIGSNQCILKYILRLFLEFKLL